MITDLTSSLALDISYTANDNINRTDSLPSHLTIDSDIEENVWEPRLVMVLTLFSFYSSNY